MTDQPITENRAQQARDYEAIHNRLFAARIGITVVLLVWFLFSGASLDLAEGLRSRFPDQWWLVNAVYVLVTLFAYSAALFPLSFYSGHWLEHRYGLSNQSLSSWAGDYFKELVLELVLTVAFLSVVYALLRAFPSTWWIWTTGVYIVLAVMLSAIWPVWIMPMFNTFEPLEDSELTQAVKAFAEQSGLTVLGVFKWGLEEKTETANAALAGLGRTRRIILADTMLDRYGKDEIIAVLAHEIGHFKNKDMMRMMMVGSLLAAIGFYMAHRVLLAASSALGFDGVADIAAFPVFMFALFLFSLFTMPLSNAYSRSREFAADEYAVRATGSADPLVRALTKLADQNLADVDPSPWIEWLLHSHPSIGRRVARARALHEHIHA